MMKDCLLFDGLGQRSEKEESKDGARRVEQMCSGILAFLSNAAAAWKGSPQVMDE